MKLGQFLTVGTLLGLGSAGPAVAGEIRNVKVTTDGSVDCSTPEAIVAATFKGRSDEEKVLSFWHWFRRVGWHYKEWPERRDLTVELLSHGQTLCGSRSALQLVIFKAAGYRARPCFIANGGHTFVEVFYAGGWHALDAETAFCVYSRAEPRQVLGLEELKTDPALITTAQAEKRVPDCFLHCAREPEIRKDRLLPWSHFQPLPTMVAYFAEGLKSGKVGEEGDLYGGSYTPGKLNLNLRPGESVTRTWDFEPGKYPRGWAYPENAAVGPYHRCGSNDEHDKLNFPYWEPYRKDNLLEVKRCYRYFANGRFDRRLRAAELLAAAAADKGLKLDGEALAAEGAEPGSLELATAFPYVLCDGDVKISYVRKAEADELSLYILEKGGARKLWSAARTGEAAETASLGRWDEKLLDLHGYRLRLVLGGSARVSSLELSTVFMHNMFAGPYLVPGTNRVTVTVDNPEALAKHPVTLTYQYADGELWKDEHSVEKVVERSPTEFSIEVQGPKHPRMRLVRLEVR